MGLLAEDLHGNMREGRHEAEVPVEVGVVRWEYRWSVGLLSYCALGSGYCRRMRHEHIPNAAKICEMFGCSAMVFQCRYNNVCVRFFTLSLARASDRLEEGETDNDADRRIHKSDIYDHQAIYSISVVR